MLLNVKYVEDNTNLIANINPFLNILVLCWMYTYLLLILSIARSRGTLINDAITSRESNISKSLIVLPERELYKSKLFAV